MHLADFIHVLPSTIDANQLGIKRGRPAVFQTKRVEPVSDARVGVLYSKTELRDRRYLPFHLSTGGNHYVTVHDDRSDQDRANFLSHLGASTTRCLQKPDFEDLTCRDMCGANSHTEGTKNEQRAELQA